jgi:CBS domain-containing protein
MKKLYEIMSHVVVTADPTDTVSQLHEKMRLFHAHQLIVMSGTKVVGVIAKRDLPRDHRASGLPTRARQLMKPAVVAEATATIDEAESLVSGGEVGGVAVMLHGAAIGFVPIATLHEARDLERQIHH